MNYDSYLLFELGNTYYGIPTIAIQEVFLIPEITPITEAEIGTIGVINWRGEILPILDLHYLLRQPPAPLQLTNNIIVVQSQEYCVGLVVDQIYDLQVILPEQIQPALIRQRTTEAPTSSLTLGIATIESTLITLLDPQYLVFRSRSDQFKNDSFNPTDTNRRDAFVPGQKTALFAHLASEIQSQLQARSYHLSQKVIFQDNSNLLPLVILELENEYFGVGLEAVRELINIRRLTPIPCCPPHILGNMNLRGEIVTLIDISQALSLPHTFRKSRKKAIITGENHSNIGIAVDDIIDVTYFDSSQFSAIPVAHYSNQDEYLQGIVASEKGMISIINLSRIIRADALLLDEEI